MWNVSKLSQCHPGRPHIARGLCRACYERTKRRATCHPTRPHAAFGLCTVCWRHSPSRRRASCHPNKPHAGHGLCGACLMKAHSRQKPMMNRKAHLRSCFSMTLGQYDKLLAAQNGGCAICGSSSSHIKDARLGLAAERRLAVDHDHTTGKIRGLLCGHCNNGLGRFNHDPARLRRAADYLESLPEAGRIEALP